MTRPPTLLIVSGPPGAGKTTLAHALADALGWPAVCRDEIKERMAVTDNGPADQLNLKALEAFFQRIGEFISSGTNLVAEAAFQDRLWRPNLEPLIRNGDGDSDADENGLVRIRVVRCIVDPEVARLRIIRRVAEEPSRAVHADEELLRRIAEGERPIESWVPIALDVPCLIVDTTEGWNPPLSRIAEFARA